MTRYMQNKTAIIRPLIRQFEHDEHENYSATKYEHVWTLYRQDFQVFQPL